jgi:hypothetical protein
MSKITGNEKASEMTICQEFAKTALLGILCSGHETYEKAVKIAILTADQMIKALNQTEKEPGKEPPEYIDPKTAFLNYYYKENTTTITRQAETKPSYAELENAFRKTHKAFLRLDGRNCETGDINLAMQNEILLNSLNIKS